MRPAEGAVHQHPRRSESLRIVVPRYGPTIVGGAETAMRRLAHGLNRRGWSVEVWTTTAFDEATWSTGFPAGIEQDGEVVVRRFPVLFRRYPRLFRQLSRVAFHAPRGIRAEGLWAIGQGPYSPSLVGALARATQIPTLFSPYLYHPTVRGLPAAPHPRILCPAAHDEPPLRLGMVRRAVLAADALWFHTAEERDLLLSVHPRAAALPWACGVVGIDPPPNLDRSAFARQHGLTSPYLYFGGRVAGGKGFDRLSSAMQIAHRRRPDVTLVVSGDARGRPDQPWLRAVGMLDEAERWQAIAGATAVIVPGAMESLSLLALEAWAVGRPCLVNGASPVLAGHIGRGRGGIVFIDSADLAEKALALLADPGWAAALGAAGKAYVTASYGWDLAEQRLRALIGAPA